MRPEHELAELTALFERSADTADTDTLERLERHATRLVRPARNPWWGRALIALAAGAAIYLGLPADDGRDATVSAASRAPSPAPGASNTAPDATPRTPAFSDEHEPFAETYEGVDVLDDLALEPGDLSDAELDAWVSVAATSRGG